MSNTQEESPANTHLRKKGLRPKHPGWMPRAKANSGDDNSAALARFHNLIRRVKIPSDLNGNARLNIQPDAVQESLRWVLKAFARHAPKYAQQKVTLAFVQQSKNGRDIRRLEIAGSAPAIVWVRGAGQDKLRPPLRVYEEFYAPAKMIDDDDRTVEGTAFEFLAWTGDSQCDLIAHLDPESPPMAGLVLSMLNGAGERRERTMGAPANATSRSKELQLASVSTNTLTQASASRA